MCSWFEFGQSRANFPVQNFIGEPKEQPRNMQTIETFEHEVQLI